MPHWKRREVGAIVILIVVSAGMVSTTYVQFLKGSLLVALWLLRRHEEGRHLFLWLRQRREARSGQPSNPT
jgi:hypothetical protein